mmetsp:Transcript_28514/g.80447  ORF Transcript_28514/g.80447 Transcript_28514/m.80447 type:complete len:336 (+) Transcript_28514:255-1262(+)
MVPYRFASIMLGAHVCQKSRSGGTVAAAAAAIGLLSCLWACDAGTHESSYRLLPQPIPPGSFTPNAGGNFNSANASERPAQVAKKAFQALAARQQRPITRADLVNVLEPLHGKEFGGGACKDGVCDAGWKDIEARQAEVVYVTSVVDLASYPRLVYIDGGAREYDSSIGGWFLASFPQAVTPGFTIFAFEMDRSYEKTYKDTPVKFMPYALFIRERRIPVYGAKMKSISGKHSKVASMGKKKAQSGMAMAIDFDAWLKDNITPEDFVVLKLDIEGAEHEVLEKMVSSGTIHLVDELFVECHYNKWSKMRMDKKRSDCMTLVQRLRDMKVIAHEWF